MSRHQLSWHSQPVKSVIPPTQHERAVLSLPSISVRCLLPAYRSSPPRPNPHHANLFDAHRSAPTPSAAEIATLQKQPRARAPVGLSRSLDTSVAVLR